MQIILNLNTQNQPKNRTVTDITLGFAVALIGCALVSKEYLQ